MTKVLILDEDPIGLEGRVIKEELGYEVWMIKNVEDARHISRNDDFDVLAVEPYLREYFKTSGSPIADLIKEFKRKKKKVLLVTTQHQDWLEGDWGIRKEDYDGYVRKPYSLTDDLCPELKRVVEARKADGSE